jgi:hypothetical protein
VNRNALSPFDVSYSRIPFFVATASVAGPEKPALSFLFNSKNKTEELLSRDPLDASGT